MPTARILRPLRSSQPLKGCLNQPNICGVNGRIGSDITSRLMMVSNHSSISCWPPPS